MRISTGYSVPASVTDRPFRIIDGVASRRDEVDAAHAQQPVKAVPTVQSRSERDNTAFEQDHEARANRALRLISADQGEQEITPSARKALQTYLQTEQHAQSSADLLSRLDLYV